MFKPNIEKAFELLFNSFNNSGGDMSLNMEKKILQEKANTQNKLNNILQLHTIVNTSNPLLEAQLRAQKET